jgi:predicted O-methyltransferase YrrM/ubiquinone/menaquinone biosynthesis C-methylase UbiE
MDTNLQNLLTELETFGAENDAAQTDRSQKMLNLEADAAKFISILARSSNCRRMLEIGTSNGYSTIWFAWVASINNGHVVSIEMSAEKQAMADNNLKRAELRDKVDLRLGSATDVIASMENELTFDFVFFDADRLSAPEQLNLLLPKIESGALVLADNVLSHPDQIAGYLSTISALPDFDHMIIPVGKGISLAYRKKPSGNRLLDLQLLNSTKIPPPLFERGAPMWDDPYIATQMLEFHLNESHDIASRRPRIIDSTVSWVMKKLDLQAGMNLLDLGCGPGLYTRRFSENRFQVIGIDYSQNSINYAKNSDSQSTYICQNYLQMEFQKEYFDAVMMIYGDFCVLSNEERDDLLAKIHSILKNGGYFIFDVTQPQHHQYLNNYNQWSVVPTDGFWTPNPYLALEQGFMYSDDISLQQYIVIQADGEQTIYRNWYHDYIPNTISPILNEAGFPNIDFYSDLIGTSYTTDSDWCGVVAYKTN